MSEFSPLQLLDALTEHEGYETAVYCTYSIDLAFFEEAVLRRLRHNRCRRHIIFVDSERYADTISQWRDCTQFVGQQYLLVPVRLPPLQAFHPKLTLLVGPERGRLLLGSGNLTFTGFGHNHELFTCLDWTPDQPETTPLFQAVWQLIETIQAQWGHNRLVNEALRKTAYQAPWLSTSTTDKSEHLAFWHNIDTSLLDKLEQVVNRAEVKRLTILTPFLDKQAEAIAELHRRLRPAEIRLILQPQQAVGDATALAVLQAQAVPLTCYPFGDNNRYLHAKLLLIETDTAVYALSGSANCTRPALLATPLSKGNVETVLLRQTEPSNYFDYLLPANLLPNNPVAPSEINLRPPTLPETGDSAETALSPIQLLDLRLESDILHLQLRWQGSVSTAVIGWQLQLDTTPPVYLPLTLTEGQQHTAVPLPPDWAILWTQPVSGRVVSVPGDGRVGDIRSNALWLCHVAALAQAAAAWYGGRIAADVLNAMAAESDEAWRGLYAEIMTLVKLDVSQASQQRPVAYSSSGNPTTARLPETEKETLITLATEAGALALTEEELLAMAVSRESELQAFFDHIRQRLPGNLIPSSPGSPRDQVTQSLPNRKWAPDRRTRVQFINLVKKYIASLQNPHFRQHTAVRDGFIYYVIFQRIIWLLHTHQGLDMANCLDFWRAINEYFFGTASSLPPVASPLLRQQCRFAWHEDWQDTAVPLYALANLWQIEQLLAQQPDSLPSHQWPTEKWRLLALLRVVVDWDDLRHSLEEMTPVAEASHLYEQPAEEMALALLVLLDTDLTAVADILEQWIAGVAFDPQQVIEPQQAALLYQANVDYRRALFHLYKQMDETTKQQQIVSDLIFWARRAGAREESYRWQERLIALYRADGDDRATAMTFYRQAQQYLRDREFTLAERLAQEGLALANQLQDEPMKEKYGRLLSNISFLAG